MYSCLSYDNLLYSITLWCNWKTVSVKGPRTLRNALFWVSLCPMISNSPVQAVEIILKWKNYTIQFNSLVIETYYSKVFCRDAENYGIIWCTLFVHICGIKLANFSAVIYRNKFKIMGTLKCLIIYFSGHSHKNHIQLSDQFIIITGAQQVPPPEMERRKGPCLDHLCSDQQIGPGWLGYYFLWILDYSSIKLLQYFNVSNEQTHLKLQIRTISTFYLNVTCG